MFCMRCVFYVRMVDIIFYILFIGFASYDFSLYVDIFVAELVQ